MDQPNLVTVQKLERAKTGVDVAYGDVLVFV